MAYDLIPRVDDSAHRLLFKIAAATSDVADPPNPDESENQLLRRIAAATAAGAGSGAGATPAFADITGAPADNAALATALDAKVNGTGGGTLATGGFTLTVPATGTAALLGTANVFTAAQRFPTGSAAATSLNFGAAGTGIFGSGSTLDFATGGLTRWTIDGNGILQGGTNSIALTGNMLGNFYYARGGWYALGASDDVILARKAAATLQLGADAAGVTNQMLTAASRITSNGVGANLTIAPGNGRGGAGGSLILSTFDTQGAGVIGNLQSRLTIDTAGLSTFSGRVGITAGSVTTSPLSVTQTWNNAGVTCRGLEYAVTNTNSASDSTLFRLLGGATGTTQALALSAATGALTIGASNNSTSFTMQGSDRVATMNLGAFGNEFRFGHVQLGLENVMLRFTDANAVTRYGTIYGQEANVLALRDGGGGTTGSAWEMLEMTAPATPAANRLRLYVDDNGSGKTRLVVKFSDGSTTVLAIQP